MPKKKSYIFILLLIFCICIGITVKKYKDNIAQYVASFIVDKNDKFFDSKKQVLTKERESIKYKHLTIFYLKSDLELLPETKSALERAIQLNENLFDINDNQPSEIIIFKNMDEIESLSKMEYANGFYSERGKLIGIVPEIKEGEIDLWNYKKTLMHEYTHDVFWQKVDGLGLTYEDFPYWFLEGIAEYVGYDDLDIDIKISNIHTPFVPLKQLTTYKQWNQYRINSDYNVYLQSYVVIKFLVHEYGNEIINKILIETKYKGVFEAGLESATGININTLEGHVKDF
ncbi:peptidase MA family metallohydrolase [Neobacillus sp. NPDC058068]|uniref:peptidase MA family metallohydrolase n=1 Tax=Neobacillus sp. NPDC058068 TaxID=3346325 RepID=UPI0036DA402A